MYIMVEIFLKLSKNQERGAGPPLRAVTVPCRDLGGWSGV